VRTVGSYWPYAPTLFDYIRRAMPQNAPQSLGNEDVYAVSAYILNLNGLLPADATLDAGKLSAIQMPIGPCSSAIPVPTSRMTLARPIARPANEKRLARCRYPHPADVLSSW